MGFSAGKIEAAMRNTNGTLEEAIEWLEASQTSEGSQVNWADDPYSAFSFERETTTKPASKDSNNHIAEDDNSTEHSDEKTQEGKEPEAHRELTPEEKEAKLQLLREKAAIRKAEREKELRLEEKKNNEIRKKMTQESNQAKEDLKRKEAIKEAAKRRKEAREDILAKQRIKDLIEADKRARKAQQQQSSGSASPASSTTSTTPASSSKPKTAPTDTKIRLRLIDSPPGAAKAFSFPVETTLQKVAETAVESFNINPPQPSSLVFISNFPKKEYDDSFFNQSIKECGLLSSSLVIKQK